MLRALVVALLVANLAFFAWTRGWLDGVVGASPHGDREPERLAAQVNPERVEVLSAPPAAVAVPPTACLEAGPFTPGDIAAAESALQAIAPAGSWTSTRTDKPGAWVVYMGSYADREALRRKEEEIRRTRAEFEEVSLPGEGEFGLSLGRYDDRAAAERGLAQVQQRGIRTARIVQAATPTSFHMIRVERADPALATQLTNANVEALGKGFFPCARPDATVR